MILSHFQLKFIRAVRLILFRVVPPSVFVVIVPSLHHLVAFLPLLGLTLWSIIELWFEDEQSNKSSVTTKDDRGSRHAILGSHLLAWWAPLIEGTIYRTQSGYLWLTLGMLFLLIGAIIRIVTVRTLGSSFTAYVMVKEDQKLCQHGLYGIIRNPSYVGLIFLNLGPSIANAALYSLAFVTVSTLWSNRFRVYIEEYALRSALGKIYIDYCNDVPRWIPKLTSHK